MESRSKDNRATYALKNKNTHNTRAPTHTHTMTNKHTHKQTHTNKEKSNYLTMKRKITYIPTHQNKDKNVVFMYGIGYFWNLS